MATQHKAAGQVPFPMRLGKSVPKHHTCIYSFAAVGLSLFMISGCASNKAETIWQQDREALQSQLKELGKGQTVLAEKFQALNDQLMGLETRMSSHAEDQEMRLDQNTIQLIELDRNVEALKKGVARKSKTALVRKSKPRKKAKVTKTPVTTEKHDAPPPPKKTPVIFDEEIKNAYIKAYLALKSGRYDQASTGFNNFLSKFPASKYADRAYYWLGETLHVQGKTGQAVEAFQKAANAPDKAPKRSAALLRLGQLYKKLGRTGDAKTTLLSLIKKHPQSPEAETARKILSKSRGNPGT